MNMPAPNTKLPSNVWRLAVAQPLLMAATSLNVFLGGIVGTRLAPFQKLATAPVACLTLGTALSVVPVTLLMKKVGRRRAIRIVIFFSMLVALVASYSIQISSFYLFCFATMLFGVTAACTMQFRFAAVESVAPKDAARATSAVMIGGIFAAILGPEVGTWGKNIFSVEFAGSYLVLIALFFAALIIVWPLKKTLIAKDDLSDRPRSLSVICKQFVFWVAVLNAAVGYSAMSLIMTATPVSMHVLNGHSLEHTKWVIQSHILAMFVPSLIAAWTVRILGLGRMMLLGTAAYIACILIGSAGVDLGHFWLSLVLLGVGWNFMFIGGTTLLPQSYLPSERFKVQALNEALVFGSQATASLSAGWVVYAMGWKVLLLLTVPLIALQFYVTTKWVSKNSTG